MVQDSKQEVEGMTKLKNTEIVCFVVLSWMHFLCWNYGMPPSSIT